MIAERIQHLPPECYPARRLKPVTLTVIHYVSAINAARDRWDDPDTVITMLIELNRPGPERGLVLPRSREARAHASYHAIVARDGTVIHLLDRMQVAYHAGKSEWKGRHGCNEFSRGFAYIATGSSGITDEQYESMIMLCRAEHQAGVGINDIVGHCHVAPGRKVDPDGPSGTNHDWARLKRGITGAHL